MPSIISNPADDDDDDDDEESQLVAHLKEHDKRRDNVTHLEIIPSHVTTSTDPPHTNRQEDNRAAQRRLSCNIPSTTSPIPTSAQHEILMIGIPSNRQTWPYAKNTVIDDSD